MYLASRFKVLLMSAAVVFAIGCDKSGSSGSAAPGKGGDTYVKKLVGTWEGTDDDMKDKDGKPVTMTVEFKADGKLSMKFGPFDLTGTYKVIAEDGKTLNVDTEMSLADLPADQAGKPDKKTFAIKFENDNTIQMMPTDKKDVKTLKRKV
jgi:hypothetical protein